MEKINIKKKKSHLFTKNMKMRNEYNEEKERKQKKIRV